MHVMFLPGAGGAAEFWHPLGALLPAGWKKTYLSWPGLGQQAPAPQVRGFDDLVALAEREIAGPVAIVAQSMGGIVGVRLALKHPGIVTHLVLAATSGGVDVEALGGADWRAAFLASFPASQTWIVTAQPDHTPDLPRIACPTLLLWGERDAISPPAVGEHLASLIPDSTLRVIAGGEHDLGCAKTEEVAPLVMAHLAS